MTKLSQTFLSPKKLWKLPIQRQGALGACVSGMCYPDMQIISNWNQLKLNKLRKHYFVFFVGFLFVCFVVLWWRGFLLAPFLKEIPSFKNLFQEGNLGIITSSIFTLELGWLQACLLAHPLPRVPLFLGCLAKIYLPCAFCSSSTTCKLLILTSEI